MANFRLCPDSGLYFDKNAESLMKVNAVAAAVSLLVAGLLALGVALTRWPAVHLLPADQFYMFLTAHGIDALIFWIIFFEIAILYFASSTLLQVPAGGAALGLAGLCADADRCGHDQCGRLPGQLQRHDDLLCTHAGSAAFLPGPDPVCGGRPDRLLRVFRHPGDCQERAYL